LASLGKTVLYCFVFRIAGKAETEKAERERKTTTKVEVIVVVIIGHLHHLPPTIA